MSAMITEVRPGLFLANYSGAQQGPADAYVVNCTRDLPMIRPQGTRVAVDDNGTTGTMNSLAMAIPALVDEIHARLAAGTPVVVHCLAGQQRSPTVVAAYLIRYAGLTAAEAIREVRARKRDALMVANYGPVLEWFESHERMGCTPV